MAAKIGAKPVDVDVQKLRGQLSSDGVLLKPRPDPIRDTAK
jgi:hypothetical protein